MYPFLADTLGNFFTVAAHLGVFAMCSLHVVNLLTSDSPPNQHSPHGALADIQTPWEVIDAEREHERAGVRQEDATAVAVRAAEQSRWMTEEAARAEERAEGLEAAGKATKEAAKLTHEVREEHKRTQELHEDAERMMAAVGEEVERALKAAEEADAGKVLAEEMACTAEEETQKAMEAMEEAEQRLKEGIQPVIIPTAEEVATAKRRIQYKEDCFHFAVTGISGSGKSSLVNAFRGLRNRDKDAAGVDLTESTLRMTRYADVNFESPYVWYDIPGAGTLKCRDWQYFNDQGLYVFDCIILLFDSRFTMTDVTILVNARRFNIPTYIVRSKADQHIRNIMMDMGYDSEGDDKNVEHCNNLYNTARRQFIEKTRRSVQSNLEDANLPDQRVYIVSDATLLNVVLKKMPKEAIDEADLLNDLINEAYRRRRANREVK